MDQMTAAFGPEIKARPPIFPPELKQWMAGAVTPDTMFFIRVAGPIGPTEIGALIEILTVQRSVLEK